MSYAIIATISTHVRPTVRQGHNRRDPGSSRGSRISTPTASMRNGWTWTRRLLFCRFSMLPWTVTTPGRPGRTGTRPCTCSVRTTARTKEDSSMLNHVTLMGRMTRDPELRHTQSGIPDASLIFRALICCPRRREHHPAAYRQRPDEIAPPGWAAIVGYPDSSTV